MPNVLLSKDSMDVVCIHKRAKESYLLSTFCVVNENLIELI